MPALYQIQELWPLFVAVLGIGFASGWFGRRALTNASRTEIKNSLKETRRVFRENEDTIVTHFDTMASHIKQLSVGAEVQTKAAENAVAQLSKFREDLLTIYFENVVPKRLDEADNLAARLAQQKSARNESDGS